MTHSDEEQSDKGLESSGNNPDLIGNDGGRTSDRLRWTTTIRIDSPRLEIGSECFTENQIDSAYVHTHIDKHSEFRSASITLNPPFEGRWDYHGGVRIYEGEDLILTGICSEAKHGERGGLDLTLRGPLWQMERTVLRKFGTFGMTNKENFYWLAKLTDPTIGPVVKGLDLDDTLRPFLFAVPLKNLKSSGNGILLTMDTGIASHEYENIFNPILAQFEQIEGEPAWNEENPKLFGTVFAKSLIDADYAARDRAKLTVGIINLALRTGISHFETRYGAEPIDFKAETSLTPVSLHPWIIIRETRQVKGWLREIPTVKVESEISLDDSLDRIRMFLAEFDRASMSGDIYDQLGRRELSSRERRLQLGTNRSLQWLNIASSEEDMRDRFTATWIALEAILNSISYPGVFDGDRATLKDEIRKAIRKINLPNANHESLKITSGMLENRILQNNWSLARKLPIFAQSLGIKLMSDDKALLGKLSRTRNTILHDGDESPNLSEEHINQLQYLVERLIVGSSIGGYEDLEDSIHDFHIGIIGPEGGGAPIAIDGKEDVPYEFRLSRDVQGQLTAEWIAEGKIYSDKNINRVKPNSPQ